LPWRNRERNGARDLRAAIEFGTAHVGATFVNEQHITASMRNRDVHDQRRHPMNKSRLLATVTASLLLGVGAVSAQSMKDQAPERAPSAQQQAPAEKVAPSMKAGERKTPETNGQSTKDTTPGEKSPGTTGQAPNNATPDNQRSGAPDKADTPKRRSDEKGGAGMNRTEDRSGPARSNQSTERERSTTTGQGAGSGSAKLSTEQRTKITTVIKQQKVQPTNLNVSVRVGTRIPDGVRFHPLPVQVIDVYPEWRGFNYILVGDQIVVIDPATHEIVAILDA
jgi:Protein of unknown function (DUF1236)